MIVLTVPEGIDKPYKGLGSGITRALNAGPHIEFIEDREGCLFTVKIARKK